MRAIVAALAISLALRVFIGAGRARPKPTAAAPFDQDALRCRYEAELATANAPTGRGLSGAMASGISTGLQQVQLQTLCMQTKGWVRTAG